MVIQIQDAQALNVTIQSSKSSLVSISRRKRGGVNPSKSYVFEGWYPDVKRGYIQSMVFHGCSNHNICTPKSIYIYVYLCCLRMGDPYFTILAEIQFDYLTLTVS
jgi:hypothetical protein